MTLTISIYKWTDTKKYENNTNWKDIYLAAFEVRMGQETNSNHWTIYYCCHWTQTELIASETKGEKIGRRQDLGGDRWSVKTQKSGWPGTRRHTYDLQKKIRLRENYLNCILVQRPLGRTEKWNARCVLSLEAQVLFDKNVRNLILTTTSLAATAPISM